MMAKLRLVGLGNRWAGDDAVGLRVAESLLDRQSTAFEVRMPGLPGLDLFEGLDPDSLLILVDACSSGGPVGRIYELSPEQLPAAGMRHTSTHGLDLAHWLALARELDVLRCRMRIFAIEIGRTDLGAQLSPEVAKAAAEVTGRIAHDFVGRLESAHA